jgi:hypothetical protein
MQDQALCLLRCTVAAYDAALVRFVTLDVLRGNRSAESGANRACLDSELVDMSPHAVVPRSPVSETD